MLNSMCNSTIPLTILYQSAQTLVVQTAAGDFDKFAAADTYGEFNLGLHVADDASAVLARRAALLGALSGLTGGDIDSIHWLNQVHGDAVHSVTDVDDALKLSPANADALISHTAGQGLAIMTADCVPIALFSENDDSQGSAVACIHAGWQGLVNGIIAKTYHKLTQDGQDGQISAIIGACISQAAYEITEELARRIIGEVTEKDLVALSADELWTAIIAPSVVDGTVQAGKVRIDIQKLARLELEKLDIAIKNDSIACSYDEPDLYSYRAQTHAAKPATGRMAMVVASLKKSL